MSGVLESLAIVVRPIDDDGHSAGDGPGEVCDEEGEVAGVGARDVDQEELGVGLVAFVRQRYSWSWTPEGGLTSAPAN